MKKYLTLGVIPVIVLSFILQTTSPIQAQAQTETAPAFCYTFTKNLGEGRSISPADAQALTVALSNAGVWNQEAPITTYNDMVASAVSGFQEKYASQILTPNGLSYGTGYVGASTRAELNSLYGGCVSSGGSVGGNPQQTQCPSGYTCTPVNQNPAPVCPPGYTCTPVGSASSPSLSSSGAVSASVTLDAVSPLTGQTTQTSAVPVLVFDIQPQNGITALTSITTNISTSGTGSVTTAYLYANTNGALLATAPVQNGVAHFTGIFMQMSANTYQQYTVKVDTANANGLTITASVNTTSGYSIVNASGVNISLTGSAVGYSIMVGGTLGSPIIPPPTVTASNESASVSLDASSPLAGPVYQNSSVPVLVFDVTPNTLADLSNLTVQLPTSGSGSITMAYLSQGGKNIATTTVNGNTAQFNQISVTPLSANTVYPFTVRLDTVNPQNLVITASVGSGNARIVDSGGVLINVNGQATGYPIIVTGTNTYSH